MLDRLVGLETEYAIRSRGDSADETMPVHRFIAYRFLTEALRRQLPLATAKHFKDGSFLANGGAVWYESERPASGAGLIEGATPECRGARQLIAYQRAQDSLLAQAAAYGLGDGFQSDSPWSLIKNDRDAFDNVYGAQENYETCLADGWRLAAWRIGLVAMLPLAFVSWIGFAALFLTLLAYFGLVGLFWPVVRRRQKLSGILFGDMELGTPAPAWMEPGLLWIIRIASLPLGAALWLHCRCFAFRNSRRVLTGFLVTRSLLCGSGRLDRRGRFHLADKAGGINCMIGFGNFFYDRPLFTMGHFFKRLCLESLFSPRDYSRLFHKRQRLQIGLGDSNMADVAEYLRVGTTNLILDAIDVGHFKEFPVVRRPIASLHQVSADSLLSTSVACRGGRSLTALDIQWHYYRVCRDFVHESSDSSEDAWEILGLWRDTLLSLTQYQEDGVLPESLIGEVDWVTKKYLLDQAGADASWEQLKKIDIRYHELSSDGYFARLKQAGLTRNLLDEDDIARARRTPPPDTPASLRGRLIREFAIHRDSVEANWHVVVFHDGQKKRCIELNRSVRRPSRWRNRRSERQKSASRK